MTKKDNDYKEFSCYNTQYFIVLYRLLIQEKTYELCKKIKIMTVGDFWDIFNTEE